MRKDQRDMIIVMIIICQDCCKWELDDSSDDDSYDYFIPGLLNICDLYYSFDYSSNYESDNFDNIKNNEDWSDKVLDYAEDLSEEYTYGKIYD